MLNSKKSILIIDDDSVLRSTIADYLEDYDYKVFQAENGKAGLEVWRSKDPDVVLVDLTMPVLNGFAVVKEICTITDTKPVIVISGIGCVSEAIEAIRLGAWEFVSKPLVDLDILGHLIKKSLEKSELIEENKRYKKYLEDEVAARTKALKLEVDERRNAQVKLMELQSELIETQKEIIYTLGDVVETRSNETANHVRRVGEIAYLLALLAGLPVDEATLIKLSSPMHDVGKIAIPDTLLNNPGKLTVSEMEIIKTHTVVGYDILKSSNRPIIRTAAIVAHEHHERWDGKGYPRGLKGEEISVYGRIICIADVFDALGSNRVYKKSWSSDRIKKYFEEERGKHFDPELTDIFLENFDKFIETRAKYPD